MKTEYVSIFAVVLVLTSGVQLMSAAGTNYADARYSTKTQTQANANECDTGTNCAINSPQTQGDGSASSPINLQISGFNGEAEQVDESPAEAFQVKVENCQGQGIIIQCTVTAPGDLRGTISCFISAANIPCRFHVDNYHRDFLCDSPRLFVLGSQTIQCRFI